MSKQLLNTNGEKLGEISLAKEVFGVEPNLHVMHLALRRQLNNARQGSACAKTRAEVSGGGKKPWKQKGTGRARAGSSRSPIWRKGGIVFGPTGHENYKISQNKKEHALALRSALTLKAQAKDVIVIDELNFEAPSTKAAVEVLSKVNAKAKTLIVISEDNENLVASARNIPGVIVVKTNNLSVYDILNSDSVVFTKESVKAVEGGLA